MDTSSADKIEQTNLEPVVNRFPDITTVLGELLTSPERRSFRLIVEGGKLLELREIEEEVQRRGAGMQDGWIDMDTAAKRLAHGYTWLCRKWRELGLPRRRIGRAIFFREADIAALIERQRPAGRRRGRPRKVVGIIR